MNPFIYGETVSGDNFCNREREIEKLCRDLVDSQKIFLISARRLGKSSLIRTVLDNVKRRKIKSVYLDIEGISTYKGFLNAYLNLLIREYTVIDRIYDFAKRFLPSIRIDATIDGTGTPTLSLGYKPQDPNLESIAMKIFELPGKMSKNRKMVIAFDEFQAILKLNGEHIEAALRSSIQHQRNVGYIFAGSKRHVLSSMSTSPDRPFYKIGPVMYLERIPRETFMNFILTKFRKTKIRISEIAVSTIIDIADDIPYFAQMISHELWDYAIADKKEISEKDVYFVLDELLKHYNQNFSELWSKLIRTKKQLLHIIANRSGKSILSKESLSENELNYPSGVQRTLELLIADGLIDKTDNEYFIIDVLFREWIKKYTLK